MNLLFEIILSNGTITLTFSLKQMTLRKITSDNSVKYITQSDQTRDRDNKPHTPLSRKGSKKFSKNNKKILKSFLTAEGFTKLK